MRREARNFFNSVLVNNRTFYWQVLLLRIIISGGRLKEHMDTINGKIKDNYFLMNSMEQMSKIFSISCQKKKSRKVDIRTDIIFSQKQCWWQ